MKNKWLFIAALSGFCCVALGAFAAHGLSHILDNSALAWIDTGLKYQLFHTLAILAVGLSVWRNDKFANLAVMAWTVGMVFFSGSLYALAFGVSNIVWITPIGGILFLIGWFSLAYGSFKSKSE
ncbi:DUF423 domain-containing protein [Rodentibacter pneumotropicus]|uniref:DUF423 domain-containing protein n=2 Tax=Rodentibacter pneumotropicus TaxID=758 RepID=A0A1V3JZ91_9PAST|nr:DUF423 domain-containing protein [Rodentibacter pneumotropicus]MCQ9121137.1 DUF423 domain-containing protein [Rodentibacter pneumotropicus]OOF60421.1 hypothetical protein BKL50_10165 [Rodentibacter pneumotropicus]OOF66103.1 hypothetical protein BKG95_11285 [Rodentibacter pneumotropicus]THA00368.1 DUF423 domain-containing protein [Rodentibacter pneumotropicus]THA01982.1 DUF423 domain-containing protein [Rodentibacter pneumotropicus]